MKPPMNIDEQNLDRAAGRGDQRKIKTSNTPKQPPHPLFIEQHPRSKRYAILEDNGTTLWLYLTAPNQRQVVADTWVFNRVRPLLMPEELTPFRDADQPPPILESMADDEPICDAPEAHRWAFNWASDGEAVAIFRDDRPIAFVRSTDRRGFSRHVIRSSPWGVPWSNKIFQDVFVIE